MKLIRYARRAGLYLTVLWLPLLSIAQDGPLTDRRMVVHGVVLTLGSTLGHASTQLQQHDFKLAPLPGGQFNIIDAQNQVIGRLQLTDNRLSRISEYLAIGNSQQSLVDRLYQTLPSVLETTGSWPLVGTESRSSNGIITENIHIGSEGGILLTIEQETDESGRRNVRLIKTLIAN